MIDHAECIVENSYSSLVNSKGNPLAQEKTYRVFRPKTVSWRGYGLIPFSGLTFNTEFEEFDASKLLDETPYKKLIEDCRAAEILCNKSLPGECDYYKKHCTPSHPKDVCMAMEDGLCHIFYSTDEELLPSLNSYYRLID
jgi:hydrogenase expression/formation protein HypD